VTQQLLIRLRPSLRKPPAGQTALSDQFSLPHPHAGVAKTGQRRENPDPNMIRKRDAQDLVP
jgi:hypothetical protein